MSDDLSGIRFGRIPADAVHLCVDMQRLFAEDTDWRTPWMERVAPNVARLCAHRPDRTVFTRFIPAQRPGEGAGTWSRYYRRWASMTLEALGPDMVELIPELAEYAPPARVFDKHVYSPWVEEGLDVMLEGVEALIVSGGETDVCVLATVLGAVDRGYRVIVAQDALCSSSDESHDHLTELYHRRFGQQIETAEVGEILASW